MSRLRRVVFGPNPINAHDPRLYLWRVWHRVMGPREGCSCSCCFVHPKRRVPAAEVQRLNVRMALVEDRVRKLEQDSATQHHHGL